MNEVLMWIVTFILAIGVAIGCTYLMFYLILVLPFKQRKREFWKKMMRDQEHIIKYGKKEHKK